MNKRPAILSIILLAGLLTGAAQAGNDNGEAQKNYRFTKQFYGELIAGKAPAQLAELNLLMTMLPKGGDIHHHYSGALYAETYLDWVAKQGYCVYRVDDIPNHREKFRIDTSRPSATSADCLSADAIRKDNGFYRQLLMRWSDKDFDNHSHEEPAPDQQFFNTFGFFGPASDYSPQDGLKLLKQQAKADNLQYLETMLKGSPAIANPALESQLNALSSDSDAHTIEQALQQYADFIDHDAAAQQAIADYRNKLGNYAAGIDDNDFTLRFQSYTTRNNPPGTVFSNLYTAFAAAHDNKLVVGVNFVGPENGYVAMRDYGLHMRMFRFLRQRFPDVRLDLHAGELTLGMVPPEGLRDHMRAALDVAGAERIGHGIDVTYESEPDQLLEDLKRRNVAVEVCLSSNAFILGVKEQMHPVTVYLRHHVPFVIATDDAGVSRSNISAEYLLFASRYRPSYDTLKQVVYNSIRYSFLSAEDKKVQVKRLDARFEKFEADVAKLARK
ncbi:MAG: adenosine deaminase [Burkholderiaceae bacterium]|nr:adenosine deaminase [Burkholderiaceae bacterium]